MEIEKVKFTRSTRSTMWIRHFSVFVLSKLDSMLLRRSFGKEKEEKIFLNQIEKIPIQSSYQLHEL